MCRVLVTAVLLAAGVSTATADVTTFEFDSEFSGSGFQPQGPAPWLTAVFDDGGSPGTVTLTLTSFLVSGEFVGGEATGGNGWFFNFSDGLGLSAADLVQTSGPVAGWEVGENGLKADGDGYFDFRLYWSNSSDRFGVADSAAFTITHAGITAASFEGFSVPNGGAGVYQSAAHVQGISGGGSGWIAGATVPYIPAPGAATLAAIGFAAVGMIGRRRLS